MFTHLIICSIFISQSYCFLSEIRGPSQIPEDPELKFGDSTSAITDTLISSIKDEEDEKPEENNIGEEILDELSELEPPKRAESLKEYVESLTEAPHESTIDQCQRDYSQPCPLTFNYQKSDDGTHKCVPPTFYSGPCRGQELSYKEMTTQEKIQWSKNCMVNWPCVICLRDYSSLCPEDWELSGGGFECKSLNSYSGPCKGETFSFIDYNIAMQKDWSRTCKSYWPCVSH